MALVLVDEWYGELDSSHRRQIDALQQRAYGQVQAESGSEDTDLHDPALNPRAFMLFLDGRLVSYAGVVTTTVQVGDDQYIASGLSAVATDPDFARRGFSSQVVAAASQYIARSGVDLGVFTCAPDLVPLYSRAGNWDATPVAVLIGSREPGSLTSTSLGVVVLTRLFSDRAIANGAEIRAGTIDLHLPVGQFW